MRCKCSGGRSMGSAVEPAYVSGKVTVRVLAASDAGAGGCGSSSARTTWGRAAGACALGVASEGVKGKGSARVGAGMGAAVGVVVGAGWALLLVPVRVSRKVPG